MGPVDLLRLVGALVLVSLGMTLLVGGVYEVAAVCLALAVWIFVAWYRSV